MKILQLSSIFLILLLVRISSSTIPVIDLSGWTSGNEGAHQQIANQVAQACRDIGFFAIQNHGVNATVMKNMILASRNFFDLPSPQKLSYKTTNETEYPYGYENSEQLQRGKQDTHQQLPDWKETFAMGPDNPDSGMPRRRFPDQPASLEPSLTAYYQSMEELAQTLLQVFAVALRLPANWFDTRMNHHISALRLLNYFEMPIQQQQNVLRASPHTDYGPLTILWSGGPGLQVKKDLEDTEWIDAPRVEDTFIVNIGDMMQRWTNDEWVSTLHRVVLPEPINKVYPRRQSIAYFVNTNGDCLVDPRDIHPQDSPKYPPIYALDHLMSKHLRSMGANEEKDEL